MAAVATPAQTTPANYHLTARPWRPLATPREAYLDAAEGVFRFLAAHQDPLTGAIVDPYLRREHFYATPYFAFTGAALLSEGRAADMADRVAAAMERATACLVKGVHGIPNECGEFFIAPLVEAVDLVRTQFRGESWTNWQKRLRLPLPPMMAGKQLHLNHWRTHAMYGEWMRARGVLVDRNQARDFVERQWTESQRERIVDDSCGLYQDRTSEPDSFACDAAARVALLKIASTEYNGRSAPEMARAAERGTVTSLMLQDPSGQCPPNGLADNHVFHDALYQAAFELLAERARERRDLETAGRCRRAAMLAFQSLSRWRCPDGSYFATKNRFSPDLRIGYHASTSYTTSNAALMLHVMRAALARSSEIEEQPTPCETGGYALITSRRFSTLFANAGGMQMVANLRGDCERTGGSWTALGVVRFARAGWDSRLGPADGMLERDSGRSAAFGPTWSQGGRWVRLADFPEHYQGRAEIEFTHPLLVRLKLQYSSTQRGAPSFVMAFTITPDGVLVRVETPAAMQHRVLWPLLVDDGSPVETHITEHIASVRYPGSNDEQNFIALAPTPMLTRDEPVHGSYGLLRPIRSRSPLTLVYPRTAGDPEAEAVRLSFRAEAGGFSSILGRVSGNLYIGRTSAGGVGDRIDLDGDGQPDVTFGAQCGFLLQLEDGQVRAIETDREVEARVAGRRILLGAYQPEAL